MTQGGHWGAGTKHSVAEPSDSGLRTLNLFGMPSPTSLAKSGVSGRVGEVITVAGLTYGSQPLSPDLGYTT